MPEKVTKEEKLVEVAIMKAKEVLAEFQHGTTVANHADTMGETVKAKRPTKNPKEEKIANPIGSEGYGYVGKAALLKDDNPYLDDESNQKLKDEIERLQDEMDDVDADLDMLDISDIKEDASVQRRQTALLDRKKMLSQRIGAAYDKLGKSILVKMFLNLTDTITNSWDSISKALSDKLAEVHDQMQELAGQLKRKEIGEKEYLSRYMPLLDAIKRHKDKGSSTFE